MRAYIIAVGDELLAGRVLDYNSYWIAKRLTSLGADVVKKVTVRDDVDEIAEEVRRGLERADIVIVIGGLGPTPGDVTLEGVAKALGRRLVLNEKAVEFVRRRYEDLHALGFVDSPELNDARIKMAKLPEGAEPVFNPIGAAPGVLIRHGDKLLLCLPGPPPEAFYVFETTVPALLARKRKVYVATRETSIPERDESKVARLIERVSREFPQVYLKTYPTGFGERIHMRVIAIARASTRSEAEDLARRAIERFLELYRGACSEERPSEA